ncbi:GspH/FimT family pseudopilin [Ideonella sp. B508-1]|uniref:GspH/FimT family pseudopilin n=1 Tax=Ideonella sp. B508-1 TaxID=137716 RepID=UPI0003B73BD4|nr:GspH/FimT family pseudopilin [Ideonella sp. B508-1]
MFPDVKTSAHHPPLSRLRPRHAREAGVTLIELMVSLVVLTILLLIVAPSFVSLMATNKVRTTASDLETALAEARSQAIRLGKRVTVCKSSDGSDCTTSGDWSQGWITFVDTTRSGSSAAVDSGETVLTHGQAVHGGLVVVGGGGVTQFVSYAPDGQAKLMNGDIQTGTLRICSTSTALDDDHRARDLALTGTGRISVTQTTGVASSCDAPD